jgi:alpha-glucosidase
VRFWLDLGVDGFRLDAIDTIFEDTNYPDHSSHISQEDLFHTINQAADSLSLQQARQLVQKMFKSQVEQPGVHLLMQELRSIIDEYDDRVLIGENDNVTYHGDGTNELHMVFNFPLMRTNELTPDWTRKNQDIRLASLASVSEESWPCNTFNNHDSSRVYGGFSSNQHDEEYARISIALLLTLRGTPFLYNGEEIGMTDMNLEDIDQFRDPWGVWNYYLERDIFGASNSQALVLANRAGRDKCRTPMQWGNDSNAGFSPEYVQTWLPINKNYKKGINVATQLDNPDSLLSFYRRLIQLRKSTPALIYGEYLALNENSKYCLAFLRNIESQTCLIAINMSPAPIKSQFDIDANKTQCLFTSHTDRPAVEDLMTLQLSPFEIYIGELI